MENANGKCKWKKIRKGKSVKKSPFDLWVNRKNMKIIFFFRSRGRPREEEPAILKCSKEVSRRIEMKKRNAKCSFREKKLRRSDEAHENLDFKTDPWNRVTPKNVEQPRTI